MANLVVCNRSINVWQFNTDTNTPPALRRRGQSNILSLAPHQASELNLGWGPGGREIRRTQGGTDTPFYAAPDPISTVRVREAAGEERVYYSVGRGGGLAEMKIYYIRDGAPVLYYEVPTADLQVPNPCLDGSTISFYAGDFTFGEGNTLYLSTGNLIGTDVGIWEVTGAGPNQVNGTPRRIHLAPGPITGLCFEAPNTLFFLRQDEVFSLDLSTGTEQLAHDLSSLVHPLDLALAPAAGASPLLPLQIVLAQVIRVWGALYGGLRTLIWGSGWRGDIDLRPKSEACLE